MNRITYCVLLALFTIFFSGCISLQPRYETPVISISSFEAMPTQGLAPQFKIGLHIVNPNRTQLSLIGISYTITLEGHKILTGVSNKLPDIEAYGEGDIMLKASVDLFSSIGFIADLIRNQKREQISYCFNAKLDTGALHRLIRVTKKGKLTFPQPLQNQ